MSVVVTSGLTRRFGAITAVSQLIVELRMVVSSVWSGRTGQESRP
jgi:hypothetical protein